MFYSSIIHTNEKKKKPDLIQMGAEPVYFRRYFQNDGVDKVKYKAYGCLERLPSMSPLADT